MPWTALVPIRDTANEKNHKNDKILCGEGMWGMNIIDACKDIMTRQMLWWTIQTADKLWTALLSTVFLLQQEAQGLWSKLLRAKHPMTLPKKI